MSHSDRPRTITVTGIGRVSVRPDIADLQLGVTITEKTVDAARSASAKAQNGILAKLKALGIEGRDLQTSIVSVNPQYDYSEQSAPPRLVGYQFTNLVAATIRDIDKVGGAIDGALGAGATSIDQISFRVADQSAAEAQAREAAVADARSRADTLAAGGGGRDHRRRRDRRGWRRADPLPAPHGAHGLRRQGRGHADRGGHE